MSNHKNVWGHGYRAGIKDAIEATKPGDRFENLLEIISRYDNEMAIQISSVTDVAIAAKYWLQDNIGNEFTASDILKLTEMILSKDS